MRNESEQKQPKIGKKPLTPIVTLEEIYAFDPERPETFTPSPLVNAVLEAMCEVSPLTIATLSKYLAVDSRKLSCALEIETGMLFTELRAKWSKNRVEQLKARHPEWSLDKLARATGFADRTALWRTDHRERRKQEYREGMQRSAERAKTWVQERELLLARIRHENEPAPDAGANV